jgi:hypothetical protein
VVVCLGFLLNESVVVIHDEIRGEYVLGNHEQAGAVEVYEMSCFESFWRCQRYYIVLPSHSLYRNSEWPCLILFPALIYSFKRDHSSTASTSFIFLNCQSALWPLGYLSTSSEPQYGQHIDQFGIEC